jgi:ADP-ribose pyrophosphatase
MVETRELVNCRVLRIEERSMRSPRNGSIYPFVVLRCPEWINVVAIDKDGRWILVRQYRQAVSGFTLEIPGGMVDEGEDPLTAARRELEEETGWTSDNWTKLGCVQPNPALQDNRCHIYCALDCRKLEQSLAECDSSEDIRVVYKSRSEILQMVRAGEIAHSLVISAIWFYCERFEQPR